MGDVPSGRAGGWRRRVCRGEPAVVIADRELPPSARRTIALRTAAIVAAAVAACGGMCFALYPLVGIPLFPAGRVGEVLLWAPLVLPVLVGPACIVPLERTRAKLAIEATERRAAQARLEEMVRRDPLTGLLNRRGFFEFPRARLGGEATLVTVDIDNFKDVNDHAGHSCGDLVLRTVASELAAVAGDTGCAARVGGDEFVVLVPATQASAVRLLHDRLAGLPVTLGDGTSVAVSASIGCATLGEGSSLDEALAHADQIMYWNKRARSRRRSHASAGADLTRLHGRGRDRA